MATFTAEELKKKYEGKLTQAVQPALKAQEPSMIDKGGSILTGFNKGVAQSAISTAQLLGGLGGRAIAAVDPTRTYQDVKASTLKSLNTDTPEGQGVQEVLSAKNNYELGGKVAAGVAETFLPAGSRKAATAVLEKGDNVVTGIKNTISKIKPTTAAKGEKAFEEALEVITPELSKLEKKQALQAGRGSVKGVLRKTVIEPSQRDIEIAKTVQGVVKPKANTVENIKLINNEIERVATQVEAGLKSNNSIYNVGEFRNSLDVAKENSRILFGSEGTLEKTYDAVRDEMVRQLGKQPKTLSGALKARKEFDKVINSKFPKLFAQEAGDDIRRNAVLDVRKTVNNFIADKLPEGDVFKEQLRAQNLMYDAIENISAKGAKEVGTNPIMRTTKKLLKNPIVKYGAPALGGGAAVKILGGD